MEIKTGDLVTIQLDQYNTASNVYMVVRNLGDECVLNHPLYPDCLIMKPTKALNIVGANLKNPTEKCLDFLSANIIYFNFGEVSEIYATIAYFIINRKLSSKQLKTISNYCGKVASIQLENNLSSAVKTVSNNVGVLDEFNQNWYENYKDVYTGKKIALPHQRDSIFNQAGFVLAQLESVTAPQNGTLNE